MQEKNMPKADFVTSIFFVAFGIAVLILSMQMPTFEDQEVNPYSVPGIVPGFLGAIVAFLGVVLFIRSIIRGGHRLDINRQTIGNFFKSEETRRFSLTIVISVIYALVLVGRVAYPVATALYVVAFVLTFEYQWKKPFATQIKTVLIALLVGVLTSGAVTGVFRYLFLVNLPG